MTTTITGIVMKVGKVKDYGHDENWGKKWVSIPKFFIEVQERETHETVLAMVECEANDSEYGLRIPKDAERQKPMVGDEILFTTHRLTKGWASVTFNQKFEILTVNVEARKERDQWINEQKQKRDAEFKAKVEREKQEREDIQLEQLGMFETEKNDDRIPESVRDEMNSYYFHWNVVLTLLRDTFWFAPIPEGEGGKQATYDAYGSMIEEGYPGTGLRRPGSALHGFTAVQRKLIIDKGIKSGIIEATDLGYRATQLGMQTLVKLDTCDTCHEIRRPVSTYSHYVMNYGNGHGYARTSHHGASYHCSHELKQIIESNRGCNSQTTFNEYKNVQKKREQLELLNGVDSGKTCCFCGTKESSNWHQSDDIHPIFWCETCDKDENKVTI